MTHPRCGSGLPLLEVPIGRPIGRHEFAVAPREAGTSRHPHPSQPPTSGRAAPSGLSRPGALPGVAVPRPSRAPLPSGSPRPARLSWPPWGRLAPGRAWLRELADGAPRGAGGRRGSRPSSCCSSGGSAGLTPRLGALAAVGWQDAHRRQRRPPRGPRQPLARAGPRTRERRSRCAARAAGGPLLRQGGGRRRAATAAAPVALPGDVALTSLLATPRRAVGLAWVGLRPRLPVVAGGGASPG